MTFPTTCLSSPITNTTEDLAFPSILPIEQADPLPYPFLQYQLRDHVLAFFSDRNQFRVPDYFRMDVSMNFEGNHKIQKRGHSSWSISFYNVTGRKNAYSVFSRATDGNIGIYRLAIFGTVIPTLVYNLELR